MICVKTIYHKTYIAITPVTVHYLYLHCSTLLIQSIKDSVTQFGTLFSIHLCCHAVNKTPSSVNKLSTYIHFFVCHHKLINVNRYHSLVLLMCQRLCSHSGLQQSFKVVQLTCNGTHTEIQWPFKKTQSGTCLSLLWNKTTRLNTYR